MKNLTIENGWVMGKLSTKITGSEFTFPVCTVEEYEKMTEEESLKALEEAMWENGCLWIRF